MPTLQLIITDAGRQAIVDEGNAGTLPVTLTEIAVGTGKWSPDATAVALQAELKRINTVGGLAVADDTLHVTVTDDSADAYALGEFGIYTDSGILFAIYSDLAGIADKTADTLLLLAADVVLTSVPPGSVTVNGVGFSNPPATETLAGVAKVATQALSDAGTDDAAMVTPKKAKGAAGVYQYTADQALADPADTGNIAELVSWIAGRIKAITGKSDWKTNPATTLEALNGERFPSGTIMLFGQSAAPIGWTKLTDHNNKALRVVSGNVSSGGTQSFTTAFSNRSTSNTAATGSVGNKTAGGSINGVTVTGSVGNTTLSNSQMPTHNHAAGMGGAGNINGYGNNSIMANTSVVTYWREYLQNDGGSTSHNHSLSMNSHSHTFTGTAHNHTFTGTAHNHTLDMSVQYVDVIRAVKD